MKSNSDKGFDNTDQFKLNSTNQDLCLSTLFEKSTFREKSNERDPSHEKLSLENSMAV